MLRFALLAAGTVLAVSTGTATGDDAAATHDAALAAPTQASCPSGQVADPACALRLDASDGEATASPSAPSGFAGSAFDWLPLRPPGAGLDLREDTGAMPPAAGEGNGSHRLLPALLALGGLVILLRRRPT